MYPKLLETIEYLKVIPISKEREKVLQPLVESIQKKVNKNEPIRLSFICTHNSRRSLLAQIWAKTIAEYLLIKNIECYSAGTITSALYPKIADVLEQQGFYIEKLTTTNNPIYFIKYQDNKMPIIAFSKDLNHLFNPKTEFIAVMTCSEADKGCPFIIGAEERISVTYQDPKISDSTTEQSKVYIQRSLQIASEMLYVFSKINYLSI